ncbi:MAG TPA: aspartate-semialdehyde dehydrogenase [Trueperaceae bacterium]|nr:aspartate-semialdehyde dehydrogenase [Trueperaceae bacterium]
MRVAIVGATGAVGAELISLLAERSFPITSLRLFASARSAGKSVAFTNRTLTIEELPADGDLAADVVFSSAGTALSREHAWRWAAHGATVIDNTSAWRMDESVPLVVPEVNGEAAAEHRGVIANPNCSTIIALMALAPLHRAFELKRAVVATYQAVSGAGAAGIDELRDQTQAVLNGEEPRRAKFKHQIAFNVFSHDSEVGDDGYNAEERKLSEESRKILSAPHLAISATCVRVPVFRAHSEAIHAEFARPVKVSEAEAVLRAAPGVALVDDRAENTFPMPLAAAGRDVTLVGRLREDSSRPGGLALFVAGDQIRKGAALNAVQIAEGLVASGALAEQRQFAQPGRRA